MHDAQKARTAEEERLNKERNRKSFITIMKRKDILKKKQLTLGVRPHTDKWVPEQLNECWEILKDEFIMWYYYMLNLPDDSKTVTDGFRNYLLAYFEENFVKTIVNQAARNHVNIIMPPKKILSPPREEYHTLIELRSRMRLNSLTPYGSWTQPRSLMSTNNWSNIFLLCLEKRHMRRK